MALADWVQTGPALLLLPKACLRTVPTVPRRCCTTARPLGSRDGASVFTVVLSGGLGDSGLVFRPKAETHVAALTFN